MPLPLTEPMERAFSSVQAVKKPQFLAKRGRPNRLHVRGGRGTGAQLRTTFSSLAPSDEVT